MSARTFGRCRRSCLTWANLKTFCDFFADAKTEMPIAGARRRAWSLRDCRRAVILQATLALRASLA